MQAFDFETWSHLAQSDPAEFEARREAALREFVEQSNPDSRKMLEQTLFTLQMHKQKAKSPLQSAIFASNLMWESYGKLRETMNEARAVFEHARPTLSLVGQRQMSQIDRIVTGWAAGATPTAEDSPDDREDNCGKDPVDADGQPISAAPAKTGARIIAFPTRR